MERLFQITAVILIGVAAFFLWRGNNDGLFIAGVLGAVCFFLSIRFQVKERMEQRKAEEEKGRKGEEEILESDAPLEEFSAEDAVNDKPQNIDEQLTKTSL